MEPTRLRRARNNVCRNNWVGVILPTFNRRELLLERALPSIFGQQSVDLTVYVIAHGCTDGTAEAVRALSSPARRGQRLRLIEIPRTRLYPPTAENHWLVGPVEPLNVGLSLLADEGWIARIDDDDEWEPFHLAKLLHFAREHDHEFVSSGSLVNGAYPQPYRYPGGRASLVLPMLPPRSALVGGCATWVYRSYLRCFRYNPDAWRKRWNRNNDTDLPERMCRTGVRMGYLPEVTVYTHPRPGETTTGSAAYVGNKSLTEDRYRF